MLHCASQDGKDALQLAAKERHHDIVNVFFSTGADIAITGPVSYCLCFCDTVTVWMLLLNDCWYVLYV